MSEGKKGFFARLKEGLTKTRNNIVRGIDSIFSGYSAIDEEFYEELEETLIMGDLGVRATQEILDRLREQVDEQGICEPEDCRAIDEEFYEELEETLIMGDLGVRATQEILDRLREQVDEQGICEPEDCRQILIDSIREQMHVGETAYEFETQQSVVMVIGVNGVGKTTSIGKLASKLKGDGKKVLIAAADTFRAAAGDQLAEWAHRARY